MNLRRLTKRFLTPLSTLMLASILSLGTVWAQDGGAAAPAADGDGAAAAAAAPAAGGGDLAAGEAVFTANCKQCHAINEQVVGPALRDAHKRWPNDAALLNFIKYPQKVIDGGNAYAKGLYDKYKQYMPNHAHLKDDEINSVIAWIKVESAKPAVADAGPGAAAAAGGDGGAAAAGGAVDTSFLNYILVGLGVVMVLIIVVLGLIVSILTKYLNNKEDLSEVDREYALKPANYSAFFGSKAFVTVITAVFVLVVLKAGFDKVYAIGINQGYAPTQPIPFSHKLHAGQYEIDCGYCHTGVYKGKSATIPSTNICLNCHNAIKTGSPNMQKLYLAVERNQPIEWVRVHNLPDLAYFNHAQHTVVGKIECEKCHGAIKEMEVVEQHSSLTMGWCINCHRETAVASEGNAYYDKLVKLHSEKSNKKMTVENIGGLECSKCHY